MNYLKQYPDVGELLATPINANIPNVNGHIHTPYSFSSFDCIGQIFRLAQEEQVDVLGINDFFVSDGYEEFYENALKTRKFPLFNVEFVGLIPGFQQKAITINDPHNPGRIYFCGKGLNYPYSVSDGNKTFLSGLLDEKKKQITQMIEKANRLLQTVSPELKLSYREIKNSFAKELVRERHIAKAIRTLAEKEYSEVNKRKTFFAQLWGEEPISDLTDKPAIANEIRSKLLKLGGAAFVPESPTSFPSVEQIEAYVLDAGGIPCYPVLLDDRKGNLITSFESDWNFMDEQLKAMNVHMVELIPSRNSVDKLREFVQFFSEKGYVVAFGSEHNTPGVFPLEVKIDGTNVLPEDLKKVAYEGACVVAAHQYLKAKEKEGFVTTEGNRGNESIEYFVKLGNAVIKKFIE